MQLQTALIALAAMMSLTLSPQASTLAGHVALPDGSHASGARVFVEMGLGGALIESTAGDDGAFRFDGVRPGRAIGVFALRDGHGFGGASIDLAIAEDMADIAIRLAPAGVIHGRVLNYEGAAIQGARVTRVALPGSKVSIPFAKLVPFGFEEPKSGADGSFAVPLLPEGAVADLKIVHPEYAQEAAAGIAVGERNARVTMYRGVVVTGNVLTRGANRPVANASVIISKSDPPRDTVAAKSGGDGSFTVRLKPGAYHFAAIADSSRTQAGLRLLIGGDSPAATVALYVTGSGRIRGAVKDAATDAPVKGARVTLDTGGLLSDIAVTGPTGEYELIATEGENVVGLESAPGYAAPSGRDLKVAVADGAIVDMPAFFLASIPTYSIAIESEDGMPVPGAVVSMLRPQQFGWRFADRQGRVTIALASLPADGIVVGLAEHPATPHGAIFSVDRAASDAGAVVRLLPLTAIRGNVVGDNGAPIEGALVDGRTKPGNIAETLILWRTLSGRDGTFQWSGVVPHLPQYCVASTPGTAGIEAPSGVSDSFITDFDPGEDLGSIVVPRGTDSVSLAGRRLKCFDAPVLCGNPPDAKALRGRPALAVYCSPAEFGYVRDALCEAIRSGPLSQIAIALVTPGPVECGETPFPVLEGKAPGGARTYLTNGDGDVVLETFGLPPLHAIQSALSAK